MKHPGISSIYVLIFSIISWSTVSAQGNKTIELKGIPKQGILLDSGWKYRVGDRPEWANRDFSDRDWDIINPNVDIHNLPMLWKDSIVWFRVQLQVDSSVLGDLAMTVAHAGASEFYLDGNLIARFGVVSADPDKIEAYNPAPKSPQTLPIIRPGRHVLAVRYTLEPNVLYTTEWASSNPGLSVTINTFNNAQQIYNDGVISNKTSTAFRVSAYLLLTIIFLAFYIANPKLKTNLYFFIYALAWTIVWQSFDWIQASVRNFYYIANSSLIFQVFAWVIYLTAIYKLFGQRRSWVFYSLIVLGLVSIPIGMFFYDWGWQVYATLFIFFGDADIFRVSILSMMRGVKGAGIIVVGAGICLLMWALFQMSFRGILDFSPWLFFNIHHLSIPVAVSIYLGYDLGLTNKSLENKLDEIKILSAEKEQILTTQKEHLEEQVVARTSELQTTIKELKATQSQLIQSEKMASLGELTAGIAHEIQNPLNFVNNFSEINRELLDEVKTQNPKSKNEELDRLVDDICQNNEKILHHGKRADAIVKSMLQHSRTNVGAREMTDINALADEYLRLAYHGMRARDKSFNCEYIFNPDPEVGKLNVVAQDIGRVLLNLINNAFYAVNEKKKLMGNGYTPEVIVSTKKIDTNPFLIISVRDNGKGIPENIVQKIFQPFYTTKPTGEGTGLGLSLSYDIIKAHGGEIKLESKENEGSLFEIRIPI